MDVVIKPSKLSGTVAAPASKSVAHRMLISAALSDGKSVISGLNMSRDIEATISALTALGADIAVNDGVAEVVGIKSAAENAVIDCCESGSTLRFIIPIIAALGTSAELHGEGKLPERPITPYIREFPKKGVTFEYNNTMPFKMSGRLQSGVFELEGNISSQFISGLLFALPLLSGDSEIRLTSHLESKPYADMTIDAISRFGVRIEEREWGYFIPGGQSYKPADVTVEGDFSQAAFFYVASAIGSDVNITNLLPNSRQGDKKIVEILREIGYTNNSGSLAPFKVDVSDIPDLVPILCVLGCFCDGVSEIYNAGRLRIKESDRLKAISTTLNELGGRVAEKPDGLVIYPVRGLIGGTVDSFNDHRIVMAAAIASTRCHCPVTIRGAEAVRKSYAHFFEDFNKLGGKAHVINLE